MCSGAIHWAKISRVVFGVYQQSLQKVSKGKEKPSCEQLINSGGQKIEVIGGVLAAEGMRLLQQFPFTAKKAKHAAFYKNKT